MLRLNNGNLATLVRKGILVLVLGSMLASCSKPLSVEGVWRSDDTSGGADKGQMTLSTDGRAQLAPDGFNALEGHYTVDASTLTLDMGEQGSALVHYVLTDSPRSLRLTYSDGRTQLFNFVQK